MHCTRVTLLAIVLMTASLAVHAAETKKAPAKTTTDTTERLGEFGAWQAFAYTEADGKVCYASAAAAKVSGGAPGRPPSYLAVTHRPTSKGEVSLIAKYQFKPDSDADLEIDGKKHAFFTKGDSAWSKQVNADKDIIAALVKSDDAILHATPAKGKPVADTVSLKGFGKALAAIDKACGVKRAAPAAQKPAAKPAPKGKTAK